MLVTTLLPVVLSALILEFGIQAITAGLPFTDRFSPFNWTISALGWDRLVIPFGGIVEERVSLPILFGGAALFLFLILRRDTDLL